MGGGINTLLAGCIYFSLTTWSDSSAISDIVEGKETWRGREADKSSVVKLTTDTKRGKPAEQERKLIKQCSGNDYKYCSI